MATSISPFVGSDASNFTRQFNVETIGGDQRQRLAEMLRSQALNLPQGQMVSGWYVAPNWTQNLNQALQTGLGVYMGSQLDKERAQKTAEALKRFEGVEEQVPMDNIPGVGVQDTLMAEGQSRPEGAPMQTMANPEMMKPRTRMRPLTQDEQDMALLNLAQINPQVGGIYGQLLGTRATRAERAAEKAEQRAFTAAENEKNRQAREDMIRLAASMRPGTPEPMVSVMDAQGNPVLIQRSQASGMTPFTPQAQKTVLGQRTAANDIQTALDAASNLMSHEGKSAGTGWSSWTQNIPSTKAKAFGADLNTYKAQGFVSAAQSLKGLGALSEKEGERLIASIGALDPSQSEEDFNKGLKTSAQTIYNKAKAAGIEVKLPEIFNQNAQPNKPAESAGRWNIRPK